MTNYSYSLVVCHAAIAAIVQPWGIDTEEHLGVWAGTFWRTRVLSRLLARYFYLQDVVAVFRRGITLKKDSKWRVLYRNKLFYSLTHYRILEIAAFEMFPFSRVSSLNCLDFDSVAHAVLLRMCIAVVNQWWNHIRDMFQLSSLATTDQVTVGQCLQPKYFFIMLECTTENTVSGVEVIILKCMHTLISH